MKTSHENFITKAISEATEKVEKNEKPKFLTRIVSGKEIVEIIWNVHAYNFDYDEVESEEDMHFIAAFLQNLQDYGDLIAMGAIEISQKISISGEITSLLKDLEARGFYVFGERLFGNIQQGEQTYNNWTISNIFVKRKESEDVIHPENLFDFLMKNEVEALRRKA